MSREPETVDQMLHNLLVDDLRRDDEAHYQCLVREDRLNTYLQHTKYAMIKKLYNTLKGNK